MSTITRIEQAIELATVMHKFQRDAAGEPYILHPLRVMLKVHEMHGSEDEQVAAVLHDVVEDTGFTLEEVRRRFGDEVARLVDAVTRRGEPNSPTEEAYPDFILRVIAAGRSARFIKEVDVTDNLRRIAPIQRTDPAKAARLEAKYTSALRMLQAAKEND